MNSLPSCSLPIQLLRLGRLAPTDSAHDELSRWNRSRLKYHLASKFSATGPVVTGHSGEASTFKSVGPAKAPEDNCHTTALRITRPMIRKALERFLSVISRPVQEFLNPPRLPSASRFEIVS